MNKITYRYCGICGKICEHDDIISVPTNQCIGNFDMWQSYHLKCFSDEVKQQTQKPTVVKA